MSDKGEQDGGGDLDDHPIFQSLPENWKPEKTILVHGYRRLTEDGKNARIYLDLTLRTYYEVPKDKAHVVGKTDPADSSKPIAILIDASEPIAVVRMMDASYLRGNIASRYPLHKMSFDFARFTVILTIPQTCAQNFVEEAVEYVLGVGPLPTYCPRDTPP
jgi:hypothetical protein